MPAQWVPMVRIVDNNPRPVSMLDSQMTIATGIAAILLPAMLVCSIIARQRYRQKVMQQRVTQLERSWNLKSSRSPR